MKRLLAWITILCILLGHVSPISTALAMDDEARDVAMSENETDAANFTKTIVAGDGSTYEIRVTYNGEIGIPAEGTELVVKELLPGDAEYDYYIAESAAKLNKTRDELTYSRLFDIKIVDANDPEKVYEPTGDVSVSIRLVGEQLNEYDNVDVLHFTENEASKSCTVETMAPSVEGENLEFTTDSFSVYVVVAHEDGTDPNVVKPRVMFHFIEDGATEQNNGSTVYYVGTPYEFKNKDNDTQTTQILVNGESLELITDPANKTNTLTNVEEYFFGWYIVEPYGNGINGSSLEFVWPENPSSISFEKPITIPEEADINSTISWTMNGVTKSGTVDSDGIVHVFLAPVYEKYNFVNFMLRPRDDSGSSTLASNLMTRKLIAKGSSQSVEVKISDIRSNSTDPIHLVFTGWEYDRNAGTGQPEDWVQVKTVDYTGAEMKDAGRDGVYCSFDVGDTTSIDLYPIFVEARWVDFVSGPSRSGATYVASRYLKSWGAAMPAGTSEVRNDTVFVSEGSEPALNLSTRKGFTFDGWYALAVTNDEGEITNLNTSTAIDVSYVDINDNRKVKTANTALQAVRITDEHGNIVFDGEYRLDIGGGQSVLLFSAENGKLKLYDELDKLTLYANWVPYETKLTIVYWAENAQDKNYVASDYVEDNYSICQAKIYETEDLNDLYEAYYGAGNRPISSGYAITYDDLLNIGLLDNDKLVELPAGDAKFYDRVPAAQSVGLDSSDKSVLADESKVISGDGSTVFNVYYDRKTFMLVFHIGRDHYVKNRGNQKPPGSPQNATTPQWLANPNWIEYMYKDTKVKTLLGREGKGGTSYISENEDGTYNEFSMYYDVDGKTYDSSYVTDTVNIKGNYVPGSRTDDPDAMLNDDNLYVITAKYGAYIGDKWPIPGNSHFTFVDQAATNDSNKVKTLYIWTAYYESRYAAIANARSTEHNQNGNNPDINGVYEYMSAELCANRDGTDLINENCVHHLVAYFGEKNNDKRYKEYHILIEAIDGTYDSSTYTAVSADNYLPYDMTTWSIENAVGGKSVINGKSFYELTSESVISNLEPEFQLGGDIEGYTLIYSCYEDNLHPSATNPYHIYFFYSPIQYPLTFMYEGREVTDTYYFNQSLEHALENHDDHDHSDPVKEGYVFKGWYDNEAGEGDVYDFSASPAPIMPNHNLVLYPKMDLIQYMIKIDPNGGVIDHINYDKPEDDKYYQNCAHEHGLDGTGHDISQATYFTADYKTPIGEYTLERKYIMLTSDEESSYSGEKYYYVNAQYSDSYDGEWGLHPDLRNAIYLTEAQLHCYHEYYLDVVEDNKGYYTGVTKLTDFNAFKAVYTDSHLYRPVTTESYTFMGWYQVYDDGTVDTMPYDFNNPTMGPVTLRALWRLEGGYYLNYEPRATIGGQQVNGSLTVWTDPHDLTTQLYADQALTRVLQAPTNVSAEWVFRGWHVVDNNGNAIQLDGNNNPVYYQPGDLFVVDSRLVSDEENNARVIRMQAFYEPVSTTNRRPDVTNLIIDANDEAYGGYVNRSGTLPNLQGAGNSEINNSSDLDSSGEPTQIILGDFQSNTSLHLNQYAPLFLNNNGFLLIGFDEGNDSTVAFDSTHPDGLRSGSPFVPSYAADAVIAVTRNSSETLYAVWEPMVYVTFVNTTSAPITINLSGTGASIVNIATGTFDRKKTTNTITVPANSGGVDGRVKIVLPGAIADFDTFTAKALNNHSGKLMSVSGEFQSTGYGLGHVGIPENYYANYSGTLKNDPNGIIVTYTETDVPLPRVFFDMNEGTTWTETSPFYDDLLGTGELYAITKDDILNNNGGKYEPSNPIRTGKVFIGWTDSADIAALSDFSATTEVHSGNTTITPPSGGIVLDKVRSDFLWNFDQTLDSTGDLTLYAVWSDAVTVTFDMTYSGTDLHNWTGPATTDTSGMYVYYRSGASSAYVTYTLAKGDRVPKPIDPTANSAHAPSASVPWYFYNWLVGSDETDTFRSNALNKNNVNQISQHVFDFSQRINTDGTRLVTSWSVKQQQTYTFTVRNVVVNGNPNEVFVYHIGVEDEWLDRGGSKQRPTTRWDSVTTELRSNETFTVCVTITEATLSWGTGYNVEIAVTDRTGSVIKSGQVLYHSAASVKGYASNYMFTLRISQDDADPPYETVITLDGNSNNGISSADSGEVTDENLYYCFTSRYGTKNDYKPVVNSYDSSKLENDRTIIFTNTNPVTHSDLTVTKAVTGGFADLSKNFSFSLTSVDGNTSGDTYTIIKNGTVVSNSFQIGDSFTLKHGESVVIKQLPQNVTIVITENNEEYGSSWQFENEPSVNNNIATITLTSDSTLVFINNKPAVAPTNLDFSYTSFVLMALFGVILWFVVFLGLKNRKEEE